MSLIKINGVDIPTPTSYSVSIQDLSNAERNATGTMIIERIATKRKIELGWSYLTKEKTSILLNAINPVFFNVQYIDPQTGGIKSGTFYCGDRSIGLIDFKNGKPRYKDIKFNLVER